MKLMKRYIIYIALCLMAAVSCEQLPEDVQIYGIGCYDPADKGTALREKTLNIDAGEYVLGIYADGEFTATLEEADTWLRFASNEGARQITGNGDMTVPFVYDINKGIPRTTVLTLQRGNNVFKLSFTQTGILEGGVNVQQKNLSVNSEGGRCGAKVITRIKPEDLMFDVTYGDEYDTGWISKVGLENNFIAFDVKANLSDKIRNAVITINYEGGKGSIQVCQFYDGCDIENMKIDDFKDILSEEGTFTFDRHIVLNGTVINDHSGKNGAENRLVSAESVDLEYSKRILYIQNDNGDSGVKLIFRTNCSNNVSRFDNISVDLYGATLKREDNPVRYSVSGVPVSNIVSTMAGDAKMPRELTLEDVEDKDIYTLVTLKELEIPVRKGSYVPVDIRNISIMIAYPMVIRSKGGSTAHMMMNVDCPWSRNGKELPRGSGSISGVLVHEKCDNFEWDPKQEKFMTDSLGLNYRYITGLGTIGKYQIRPMEETDVNLNDAPFSTVMYEWGYCNPVDTLPLVKNYEDKNLYPTYAAMFDDVNLKDLPKAQITDSLKKTNAVFYCFNGTETQMVKVAFKHCHDYTHLGPYTYGKNMSDHTHGNGIFDYKGTSAFWVTNQGGEKYGVLYSNEAGSRWTKDNGATWCTSSWNVNKYWGMEFSTAGLTEDNKPLNLTFGTVASITKGPGLPRYWIVQWCDDGKTWKTVHEYTVPDFVNSANLRAFQLPGIKYITVNLPDEILGKEKVYVRLKPKDTKVGGASYDDGAKIESVAYNGINYVAIRYNK